MPHDDDAATIGRVLARREMLALLGTSAGFAVLGGALPAVLSRGAARAAGGVAWAAPSCVVRPEMTEGPFFVDAQRERSDIRSDPATGATKAGAPFALSFAVSAVRNGRCEPFPGVLVDVWHCDAGGVYSGVRDGTIDTTGQQFLRGYQVTDAGGGARFVTIYPGWYPGRTVHVHFKLRTTPGAAAGLEFTSQLYFDDAFTDAVFMQPPYAGRGARPVRNAGDAIYRGGGAQLLLDVGADGPGGYAATFDVALDVGGTTSTTTVGATTTSTTLPDGACATVAACLAAVQAALPDPDAVATTRARRTATRLRARAARVAHVLRRAAASSGARRARRYAVARARLRGLLAAVQAADAEGMLGTSLAALRTAIGGLLAQLPAG